MTKTPTKDRVGCLYGPSPRGPKSHRVHRRTTINKIWARSRRLQRLYYRLDAVFDRLRL